MSIVIDLPENVKDFRPVIFFLFTFIPVLQVCGQDSTLFSHLAAIPTLEIEITVDFDTLLETRNQAQDVKLRVVRDDEVLEEWNAELQSRGKYRRRVCDFPPVELNFKKKDLRASGYLPFDKFKLVTHCLDTQEGEENILQEYVAYRLYNLITDFSFRVKLLSVSYLDTHTGKRKHKGYGMLIEPTKEMAHRLGGEEVEIFGLTPDSIDAHNYTTVALYNFLIGNFDWDLLLTRNIKLVRTPDRKFHIVPYDFDFAAIVSPSYARLSPDFEISSIRDRVYLGQGHKSVLASSLRKFTEQKSAIMRFCAGFEELKKRERKDIQEYLEACYAFFNNSANLLEYKYVLPHEE